MKSFAIPESIIPKLPLIIGILILVLLAASLASSGRNIYLLLTQEEEEASVEPLPPTNQLTAPARINYSAHITRKHLLGAAASNKRQVVDAPPSKLNLKLRGIYSTDDGSGAVIIADGSGKEDVYRVNDDLPGGARLVSIQTKHVIIERNQQMEKLVLPEGPSAFSLSETPQPSSESGGTTGAELQQLRQELIKNPTSLGKLVSLSPSLDSSGQLQGYKIYPRGKQPLFEELGLKSGDLVTEISGTPLNDSKQSLAAIQKLMTAKVLDLTIRRNGETLTIHQSLE